MATWWSRFLGKRDESSDNKQTKSDNKKTNQQTSTSISTSKCERKTSEYSMPQDDCLADVDRIRKRLEYDVCICHAEKDFDYALDLVCYLEGQKEAFRCFMQLRDAVAGGAIATELCNALTNSHCWVLLITKDFLQDCWCNYQMQQALAQAPMASGRIIPFVKDLQKQQCPRELMFMYKVLASSVKDEGFGRIKVTLVNYFKELRKNERPRSSFPSSGQWTTSPTSSGETS